ncbi:MAG: hypothetical protein K2J60_16290 [Acetatifactor sp.]|nr:hypothetical protein [Acetatifactor sp.]
MFEVDKEKIGKHIAELIDASEYKSDRQFGIAYLKLRYGSLDEAAIPNIQNRICQIKKGNKWIQIEDLPIFAELLRVSIEDIVSAGTSYAPVTSRVTNYSIASSNDPDEFEAYVKRADKLFLNPDEYNKTVIDYALEAGNYQFLKYLMDKKHIWFVGPDKKEYHNSFGEYAAGFGAGTDIKRRAPGYVDILDTWLKDKDDLRFKMISLAIKHNDFDMLNRLHAKEIPLLYTINHFLIFNPKEDKLPESKNVTQFLQNIATCPNTTLAYFFEPFTIESAIGDDKNTFFFPYAGNVLDIMIKNKASNTARFIEMATKYNKTVLAQLLKQIDNGINLSKEYYDRLNCPEVYNDVFIRNEALRDYYFYSNTGFVAFTAPRFAKKDAVNGFITNVIHVTSKSSDAELQFLINELNEIYDTFVKYLDEKENCHLN